MQFTSQAVYLIFFRWLIPFNELNQLMEGPGECQRWGSRAGVRPTGEQAAETPLLWQQGWLNPSTQAVFSCWCGNPSGRREQDDLLFRNAPQVAFILHMTGSLQRSHSCGTSGGMRTTFGRQAQIVPKCRGLLPEGGGLGQPAHPWGWHDARFRGAAAGGQVGCWRTSQRVPWDTHVSEKCLDPKVTNRTALTQHSSIHTDKTAWEIT